MNAKRTTKRTKTTKATPGTLAWLTAPGRRGLPRIQTLSWGRLAQIYRSRNATPAVRRAIEREARRLGYDPDTIMACNAWL